MPYCTTVRFPDGTVAHLRIAGRRPQAKTCSVCGRKRCADLLCDGRDAAKPEGTCDAPLCGACAREVGPDRHLCPPCARRSAQREMQF